MTILFKWLTNRNVILPMGILIGFLFGDSVAPLKNFTIYIIGLVLALSTASFDFNHLKPVWKNLRPMVVALLMTFVLFPLVLLSLSSMIVSNEMLRIGLVIIAATPPAIAVIPFSANLGGDLRYTIQGVFGANLLAVIITPFLLIMLLGDSSLSSLQVFWIMMKMLVFPMAFSRLFRFKKVYPLVLKYRSVIIDYGFFIISFTVIGLSRNLLLEVSPLFWKTLVVLVITMFTAGFFLDEILLFLHVPHAFRIGSKMMFALKNAGFASVVALNLFDNPIVALPAALLSVLLSVYYIVQSLLVKYKQRGVLQLLGVS